MHFACLYIPVLSQVLTFRLKIAMVKRAVYVLEPD